MRHTNLLFMFTDEQRYDTLSAYGNDRIQTPSLDRLASQSVVFDRAYVTQPVCTPSRASIVTGLYPHTAGCMVNEDPLNDDVPALPEMLTAGRYATAYHGKWHVGRELLPQHGFDEWVSIEDHYYGRYREELPPEMRSSYHQFLTSHGFSPANGERFGRGEAARLPEEFGKPAFLAREASRFIRENRDGPFVLYVNFLEPHMPFYGPRDGQYEPADVSLPPNLDAAPGETEHLKLRLMRQAYCLHGIEGHPLQTEDDWRELIARYWGLCSLVDTYVGMILRTLEECGLYDDTIIVFTSDHGDMMGSHGLVAKMVMYEEAVRVPLLVKLPGQTSSRRVRTPISQIDLVPTLLDILGESIPPHLQGKSLRLFLGNGTEPEPRDVFIEWTGRDGFPANLDDPNKYPAYMAELATREEALAAATDPVRTVITPDGWKLNYSRLGMHELYNLARDPFETTNLGRLSDMKSVIRDLSERIHEWQVRTGDELTTMPRG